MQAALASWTKRRRPNLGMSTSPTPQKRGAKTQIEMQLQPYRASTGTGLVDGDDRLTLIHNDDKLFQTGNRGTPEPFLRGVRANSLCELSLMAGGHGVKEKIGLGPPEAGLPQTVA
jgi:hypothetical protein